MKNIPAIIITLACISSLLPMRCANPNAGNGSDVGNARITAMLYNTGGTPAVNAKVCFYSHDEDPRGSHAIDSTYTDTHGNYSKGLDTGTYNILATLDTIATFQDSIVVRPHDTARPPSDTLKTLGGISGKIELQGSDDPRTVFVLFMGSNTFAAVNDTQGNFSAANMAKGKYRVRILTTLDNYRVMDTVFGITAGVESVILTPIRLEYTGIPVPQGLRIGYDTMKQIVTLTWNKPTNGRAVQSYTVYRKRSDSATFVNIKSGVTDTTYSDSSGVQDQTYEYRVAVVDTNNTEGVKSAGVGVKITSAFHFVKVFGTLNGESYSPSQIVFDSARNVYVLVFFSGAQIQSKIYKFKSDGSIDTAWIAGQFSASANYSLRDIEITHDTIFALDQQNKRMKLYTTNGDSLSVWSIAGSADPNSFTIKNGFCYITDHQTNRVLKYSSTGDSISSWASIGIYNLKAVKCIATTATSPNLYLMDADSVGLIADTTGKMISRFSIEPRACVTAGTQWILLTSGELMYVGIDRQKVFVIDTTGRLIAQFGAWGTTDGLFNYPAAVGESSDNQYFVSDAGLSRIQVFSR